MGVKIRKKGGKYYVFINWKGRRKAKAVGSKWAAEAVKAKVEAKLALGDFQVEERPVPRLAEYSRQWLLSYARIHCKESTWQGYERMLRNHVLPRLGAKRLGEVTRGDVKLPIADLVQRDLSRSTVHNVIAPLREMLQHAVDDGFIGANPALRIGRFAKLGDDQRLQISPFTSEEVAEFLATAREHYPRYHPLFLCAVRTGLRLGELIALQWGDIDLEGRFIEVRRNYVRGRLGLPKNGKIRRVDMSHQLTQALWLLKKQRVEEKLREGWKEMPKWVFVNEERQLLDDCNLRKRVFYPCLTKARLRRIRFHDLRHTFASLLIGQGESLAYVKEQMGHHSIQVTVDIYGHMIPGANKEAVDKLDDTPKRNLSATGPTKEPLAYSLIV